MVTEILELEEAIETLLKEFEDETSLAIVDVAVVREELDEGVGVPNVKIQFVLPYRTSY